MEKYKYGPYRICAPQIIYNSISPASIRKTLFDRLINLALPSTEITLSFWMSAFLMDFRRMLGLKF